jgi:tRNA threonylcarbamoyladenosine biosynthesis protein TsaB
MAAEGQTVLPAALLPDYHRLSQAERERAEKLAAAAKAAEANAAQA